MILHACSGIFALDYFHKILVLASALFHYHFLLSVQAKKNIICSLQKKNSTASSAQFYLFARTSLLPGSGCCDSSDHPTVCVTSYTYRDRETIAHMKKRNTDWVLHARVGHHWIKVTNLLR